MRSKMITFGFEVTVYLGCKELNESLIDYWGTATILVDSHTANKASQVAILYAEELANRVWVQQFGSVPCGGAATLFEPSIVKIDVEKARQVCGHREWGLRQGLRVQGSMPRPYKETPRGK